MEGGKKKEIHTQEGVNTLLRKYNSSRRKENKQEGPFIVGKE